jgi:MauM/NapG family ferredoxin protein
MMGRTDHKRTKTRWLRVGVQTFCLGLFVYLAFTAHFKWKSTLPYDLFVRFDPLVWLLVSAATREFALYGSFALALVIATALFGRVFCGWVCPLGTVIDAAHLARDRRPKGSLVERLSNIRFLVLIALIGAAIAGVNLAGWLDPLVMSSRSLHLGIGVRLDWAAAVGGWTVMGIVIGLVFFAPRFWCRTLCPLGAALSLVARLAPYRRQVGESCIECDTCSTACPMGQSRIKNSPIECIGCRRCEVTCPEQAIAFRFDTSSIHGICRSKRVQPINPWRRRFVLGLGSLASVAVARFVVRDRSSRTLLRPPGALSEQRFVARCMGCGTCVATCPTGGLLPLVSVHRLDAVFSPRLVPRVGPCLPDCTACGDACPTGAIARIPVKKKTKIQIGIAIIDRTRCQPWAGGERCVICLDACPSDYSAIELQRTETGEFRPYVKEQLCTGCGICEYKCPMVGESAIRVVAAKEMVSAK